MGRIVVVPAGGHTGWIEKVTRILLAVAPGMLLASAVGAIGPSGHPVDVGATVLEGLGSGPEALSAGAASTGSVPSAGGVDQRALPFNEPTVVVNPLDPDNFAVADLFFLRVSNDRGASFEGPAIQLPPPRVRPRR